MQSVLRPDQTFLAGQETFRDICSSADPIIFARILAESFQYGFTLTCKIDSARTPIPTLHVHRAFGSHDIDRIELPPLAGKPFAIKINKTGLHMTEHTIAMVHDEHRILVGFDFDFAQVLNFASGIQNRGHSHDLFHRSEQAGEGRDVVYTQIVQAAAAFLIKPTGPTRAAMAIRAVTRCDSAYFSV